MTYPVLNDPELLTTISSDSEIVDSIKDKADLCFSDLARCIQDKTEKAKQAHKLNMIKLANLFKSTQDCLNEVAGLEDLRRILLEEEDNEEKLAEFISNHLMHSETNT